jgi:hypothetical protein
LACDKSYATLITKWLIIHIQNQCKDLNKPPN